MAQISSGAEIRYGSQKIGHINVSSGSYGEPEFSLVVDNPGAVKVLHAYFYPDSPFEIGDKVVQVNVSSRERNDDTISGSTITGRRLTETEHESTYEYQLDKGNSGWYNRERLMLVAESTGWVDPNPAQTMEEKVD